MNDSMNDSTNDSMIDKGTDLETRRKRLKFRAWHRGTQEADIIIGSFVDRQFDRLSEEDCIWFEHLLSEADLDILSWIMGKVAVPDAFDTDIMHNMQKLDYLPDNK